jgi:hypothetical protein
MSNTDYFLESINGIRLLKDEEIKFLLKFIYVNNY